VVTLSIGVLLKFQNNMLATFMLDGTVVLVSSIKDAITTAEELRGA